MDEYKTIRIPSTRYQGSKRKLIPWMYSILKDIKFNSVLDVFGGTGVVSYLFKLMDKEVTYNDYMEFNYQIGLSLIENERIILSEKDIKQLLLLPVSTISNQFIPNTFKNIYYKEQENIWIDNIVSRIHNLNHYKPEILKYKKAIAFNALFQSCLVKRPFNLFHRKNLSMRIKRVQRSFGNKTTWETPFNILFERYTNEINSFVLNKSKKCKASCFPLTKIDASGYDLIYLDPPYLNKNSKNETSNYFNMYHFLEGLTIYPNWNKKIDHSTKNKRLFNYKENIFNDEDIYSVYEMMFEKFQKSIIVLSYKSQGIPSIQFMVNKMKKLGKVVYVHSKEYSYSLKNKKDSNNDREYLIIGI